MAVKRFLLTAIAVCLMAIGSMAQHNNADMANNEKVAAILKAVELYAEAGRRQVVRLDNRLSPKPQP